MNIDHCVTGLQIRTRIYDVYALSAVFPYATQIREVSREWLEPLSGLQRNMHLKISVATAEDTKSSQFESKVNCK
jgi:hypothetical protein